MSSHDLGTPSHWSLQTSHKATIQKSIWFLLSTVLLNYHHFCVCKIWVFFIKQNEAFFYCFPCVFDSRPGIRRRDWRQWRPHWPHWPWARVTAKVSLEFFSLIATKCIFLVYSHLHIEEEVWRLRRLRRHSQRLVMSVSYSKGEFELFFITT